VTRQTAIVNGIHAMKYAACQLTALRTSSRWPGVCAIHTIWAADSAATNSQKPVAAAQRARPLGSD
jgi:hypothetical protein